MNLMGSTKLNDSTVPNDTGRISRRIYSRRIKFIRLENFFLFFSRLRNRIKHSPMKPGKQTHTYFCFSASILQKPFGEQLSSTSQGAVTIARLIQRREEIEKIEEIESYRVGWLDSNPAPYPRIPAGRCN